MYSNHSDIHDYTENFIEKFSSETIPIYALWSIRALENDKHIITSGTSKDVDKFRDYISDHASKEYPHPLVIVIGNAERGNPNNMVHSSKKNFKIRFDVYKGNDLGTPLALNIPQNYPTGNEQMIPLSFSGVRQKPSLNNGMQGVSYSDIQGIVDKNVSDAKRSIQAEYAETAAKREVESIKKFADLEMKMEFYKLDMRAKDIEEKERRLREELDDLELRKSEGLGSIKDYTKTIAGGLLEVGKTAFGIEDKEIVKDKAKPEIKDDDLKGSSRTTNFDDAGFSEKTGNTQQGDEKFAELLGMIKNLNEDQKYALLDTLMPDEEVQEAKAENEPEIKNEEVQNTEETKKLEEDEKV